MRAQPSRVIRSAIVLAAFAAMGADRPTGPASDGTPSPSSHGESLRRFQDGKLGLSIHWGISALLAKGEGVMEQDKLPVSEYEKLAPRFNPAAFDAGAWVKAAKSAGAKSLVVTAKGPDGFCLFNSKQTRFDVLDATPFGKDPLKLLAEACRAQGLPLVFSYSLLDWHHPDYFPRGRTGGAAGREEVGRWDRYLAYYQAQVRELCTQYGEIGGLWLLGDADRPDADWDLERTYQIVHELQPSALVGNDRRVAPRPGQDLALLVDSPTPGPWPVPSESPSVATIRAESINESWGFDPRDRHLKAAAQLVRSLLEAAGRGANLELAVAARPDGSLEPEHVERLQELGKWLEKYGESVYATRMGPVPPQPWGVSTSAIDESKLPKTYLHILKPEPGPIRLPGAMLTEVPRLFGGSEPLKMTQDEQGVVIELAGRDRSPIDTIIVLTPKLFVPETPARR